MSTDWDIRCVDCDETFDYSCDSRERLRKLMILGPDWLEFYDRCRALGVQDVMATFDGLYPFEVPIRAHLGHHLVLHDEYGRDEGQCDKGRTRWDDPPCSLDQGHTGSCLLRSRRKSLQGARDV